MQKVDWNAYHTQHVLLKASETGYRTGQWMFNNILIPDAVMTIVRGTTFDPFFKDLSAQEIYDWFDNHVIFGEFGEIVGIFDGNTILWQEFPPDMAVPAVVNG